MVGGLIALSAHCWCSNNTPITAADAAGGSKCSTAGEEVTGATSFSDLDLHSRSKNVSLKQIFSQQDSLWV